MNKSVIAFDFDDVLISFNVGFAAFHNRVYGTKIRYEDVQTFDIAKVYGCDKDEMVTRVQEFYWSRDHDLIDPIPGAVDAVRLLSEKYHLEIVTSRVESLRGRTQSLLDNFFPKMFSALHFTNGFGNTVGNKTRNKSEVCIEINAKVLIEDALKHAEEVAKSGIPVLLPDRPWNQDYTPEGVIRIYSWSEAASWIEKNI